MAIGRRAADIFTLQRHGGGQHDIRVARASRPGALMDDQRIETAKGLTQPRQILMMMKRVAARPVGQPNVGIGQMPAVIVKFFTGMQQHIGDTRDRNKAIDAVFTLRQRRKTRQIMVFAVVPQRAERIGKAAAWQARLPQRGRKRQSQPDRLLTMLRAAGRAPR